MYKIAVLGGRDTVLGFKALGLDTFPVTEDDVKTTFEFLTASENRYAIIYVEENFAVMLSKEIEALKDSASPAVILIPGRDGSLGLGRSALHEAALRAVGTDIL